MGLLLFGGAATGERCWQEEGARTFGGGPGHAAEAAHPGLILALGPVARAAGTVTLHLRPNGVEVACRDRAVAVAFVGLLAEAQAHAPADSPLQLLDPPGVADG